MQVRSRSQECAPTSGGTRRSTPPSISLPSTLPCWTAAARLHGGLPAGPQGTVAMLSSSCSPPSRRAHDAGACSCLLMRAVAGSCCDRSLERSVQQPQSPPPLLLVPNPLSPLALPLAGALALGRRLATCRPPLCCATLASRIIPVRLPLIEHPDVQLCALQLLHRHRLNAPVERLLPAALPRQHRPQHLQHAGHAGKEVS
mmetsp:Transcript_5978/g.19041  ORF Transcript_5978/g.19041 Transcript_5978/m.19041 type:complete len:201 (+) Transcript_5978:410-1012(+)